MDWFERITTHQFVEMALVADNQGHLLQCSRRIHSDDEMLPAMLQALEVIAQSLSDELGCGVTQMVMLSSQRSYLLLFPLYHSTYYVLVMVGKSAPLPWLIPSLEQMLETVSLKDFAAFDELPDMDAHELIEAVREWLLQHPRESE
jgi:predicted regulator of Ras-like GTPase activity (Roadblock/LC7/MglB family)